MIVDGIADEAIPFFERTYDVCIAGAGFAGITLACKLAAAGYQVALCEAGGLDYDEASQDFYRGRNIGHPYYDLDVTRLRYLGGGSNHWNGWCRPLDDVDFEPRPDIDWSGWPIRKPDLDPYAAETGEILELSVDPPPTETLPRLKPNPLRYTTFAFSPPTRMGEKYREALQTHGRVTLLLNSAVTRLWLADPLNRVDHAVVRNLGRRTPRQLRARFYVVCLGGIETPRLLLLCDEQVKTGLGNEHDLVGRFFAEHPEQTVGYGVLWKPFQAAPRNVFLAPTREFMRERRVMNFGLIVNVSKGATRSGAERYLQEQVCHGGVGSRIVRRLIDDISDDSWCDFGVVLHAEQAPNYDSRIVLTEERDVFGDRRIALDWRLQEIDWRTLREAAFSFGRMLAEQDVGRLRLTAPLYLMSSIPADFHLNTEARAFYAGHHHMCTTRMADSGRTGVVNRDLRLFNVDNLYVCGSSTFSTGGFSNPTFTLVQLALRLADHLIDQLRR